MERFFKNSRNQSEGVERKKILQKKQIIRTLYYRGTLSNAELSVILKLSTPKINNLLIELIEDGLVKELGRGDSSGGRRPNIYGLTDDLFYVIGITINIKRTIISLFNSNNKELGEPLIIPVGMKADFQIFERIQDALDTFLRSAGIEKNKILAMGIEHPGLFDQKRGINKTYFPGIENLSGQLKELFGLPVFINHDSKIRALAEKQFGVAQNRKNVLVLHIDWGVGLGIIINGKLYSGKSGYSGEFGHLPIAENGVLCTCGKKGCLETIISATAIVRIAREGIQQGMASLINDLVQGELNEVDISTVIEAAYRGDQFAISIFSVVGFWLGKGIVYLMQIFNPELIVIGGRVAEANLFIRAPLRQAINTFSNRDLSNDTEIEFSVMGQKAGLIGAAAYALDRITSV
ncbi:MAG: ROK family protein [Mariniphaga sp.]|nr:ROK family protein [Mariniphaga sp.]